MKTIQTAMAWLALCCATHAFGQTPAAYSMPNGRGTLLLGVAGSDGGRWITPAEGKVLDGKMAVRSVQFDGSRGFAVEVTNLSLPDSTRLVWVIGGFDAKHAEPTIRPEHCHDNVFSVEGSQVAVYHGEVMRLRFTKATIPSGSDVRLCDGRQLGTPVATLASGKQTDAPVLAGSVTIRRGEPAYISIGNPRGTDIRYADLPHLFDKKD